MDSVNLYIVVPCYNEEAVLPETAKKSRRIVRGGNYGWEEHT